MSLLKVNAIQNFANEERFGLTLMEPKAATGTAVDFTGIPAWAKRITVMFIGVSKSATSNLLVQLGSTSVIATGYNSTSSSVSTGVGTVTSTAGFIFYSVVATDTVSGTYTFHYSPTNTWIGSAVGKESTTNSIFGGGDITLSGTLDRIRITTVNGTDTFDAGTFNVMYE